MRHEVVRMKRIPYYENRTVRNKKRKNITALEGERGGTLAVVTQISRGD